MDETQAKATMESLSQDALAALGCYFGMGSMQSTLTFHMEKSRPTKRLQDALDECVNAKVLSRAPFNEVGGVTYAPLIPLHNYRNVTLSAAMKAENFTLTEPISS